MRIDTTSMSADEAAEHIVRRLLDLKVIPGL